MIATFEDGHQGALSEQESALLNVTCPTTKKAWKKLRDCMTELGVTKFVPVSAAKYGFVVTLDDVLSHC